VDIGNPYLVTLRQSCPSSAHNRRPTLIEPPLCSTRLLDGESAYLSFAYSSLACFKIGTSESASFQSVRKYW